MVREVKRVNFNVPVDTLDRIDSYAERMSINRTSAMLVLINQALDGQKAITDMGELLKICQEEQVKRLTAQFQNTDK